MRNIQINAESEMVKNKVDNLRWAQPTLRYMLIMSSILTLLMVTACGGGGGGNGPTSPSTTISFSGTNPGSNTVYMTKNSSLSSGNTLAIDVKVNNLSNVYGAAFDMDFDSSKMTYSSYVKGDFLGTVEPNVVLQSGGSNKLVVGVSKQGTATGATGSGTLVTLKFNVTSGGSLAFSNSAIMDPSNQVISGISWSGGTVTVQ